MNPATRRRALLGAIALVLVAGVIIWGLLPWEWSTIDDAGIVLGVRDSVQAHGILGLPVRQFTQAFEADLGWGLFRPAYWLYPILYVLPSPLLHMLRLVMLLVAIAGPLVYLRRHERLKLSTLGSLLPISVVAATALAIGLFFLSLQELSGAALVGLGLMARRPWLRTASWLVAAWFKAPFAWLLIGDAIVSWRQGDRRRSLVSGALGMGTLAVSAWFARGGGYTDRYLRPTLWGNIDAAFQNAQNLLGPLGGSLLLCVVWWLLATSVPMRVKPISVIVLIGFTGYTTQLLLWEVSGHYLGPIVYLAGAGLILAMAPRERVPWMHLAVAASIPAILATIFMGGTLLHARESSAVVGSVKACLLERSGASWALTGQYPAVFTLEGADRMAQAALLEDPRWEGTVTYVPDALTVSTEFDFIIAGPESTLPATIVTEPVCRGTAIAVHSTGGGSPASGIQ